MLAEKAHDVISGLLKVQSQHSAVDVPDLVWSETHPELQPLLLLQQCQLAETRGPCQHAMVSCSAQEEDTDTTQTHTQNKKTHTHTKRTRPTPFCCHVGHAAVDRVRGPLGGGSARPLKAEALEGQTLASGKCVLGGPKWWPKTGRSFASHPLWPQIGLCIGPPKKRSGKVLFLAASTPAEVDVSILNGGTY